MVVSDMGLPLAKRTRHYRGRELLASRRNLTFVAVSSEDVVIGRYVVVTYSCNLSKTIKSPNISRSGPTANSGFIMSLVGMSPVAGCNLPFRSAVNDAGARSVLSNCGWDKNMQEKCTSPKPPASTDQLSSLVSPPAKSTNVANHFKIDQSRYFVLS